jgi:3-hydroxyisobutyrate dehydrogenase-like beta-hydroxyacid dehydrogenase
LYGGAEELIRKAARDVKREIVNLGFIGLGAMGLPMAKRVVAAGYKTYTTFLRRREPAEESRALGAEIKLTPREVAASADVIITILPADAEPRETVFGPQAILAGFSAGKVLVEMTRCGVAPATFYDVIRTSSGYSKLMDLRLPGFLLTGSFQPGFKLDLITKDVNLAVESARALGIPLLMVSSVAQIFAAASAAGKGGEDFAAAAQFLASLSGLTLGQAMCHA